MSLHPYTPIAFTHSASIDPPEFPPDIEPTAEDCFDARDQLADAECLAEFLGDICYELAPALYRGGNDMLHAVDTFRDRARVRCEAWINARALQIAEQRIERERRAAEQDHADGCDRDSFGDHPDY